MSQAKSLPIQILQQRINLIRREFVGAADAYRGLPQEDQDRLSDRHYQNQDRRCAELAELKAAIATLEKLNNGKP